MRKYHRWLSVLFGVFLLWIATTGVMSQLAAIKADGEVRAVPPAGFVCPATMSCRPKPDPKGAGQWVGWLHHLHSGEEFGPLGTAISIASGVAMMFFAFSGLWMYLRMWRDRRRRAMSPGWFWK